MIYAKAFGVLGLIAFIGLGLWHLYRSGYDAGSTAVQAQWDADRIRRDEAQRDALLAYAEKVKHAQEQHDHDQIAIDTLADNARRLRIHLPACGDGATAGAGADRGTRLLPATVDQRFAAFQERVGRLIQRCDQLNIDAIRANAAGAGQR